MLPSLLSISYAAKGNLPIALIINKIVMRFHAEAACRVRPIKCQYKGVIAKSIVEMFNLLPGATRSGATTSKQPLQTFSESLLAASKSFLQGSSAADGSSKSGRRQRSASGDAKSPSAGLDGGDALSSIDSQRNPKFNGVNSLQTLLIGSTDADGKPAGFLRQLAESQLADGSAASQSGNTQTTIAQAGVGQTSIVAKNLILAAGYQSRFTSVKIPLAGQTTNQIIKTVPVNRAVQNAATTSLADIQSSPARGNTVRTNILEPSAVASNCAPATMPLAQPAATPISLASTAIPVIGNAPSTGLEQTLSIIAQASSAPTSMPQARAFQPALAQSDVTPVQTSIDRHSADQNASTAVTSQPSWNVPLAGSTKSRSMATLASIISTSISQPAVRQSNVAPVEIPFGVPVANQSASTAEPGRPARAAQAVTWNGSESSLSSTGVFQLASLQSKSTQTTADGLATAPAASTGVISQSSWNVPSARSTQKQSTATLASIVSSGIPQSTAPQSNVVPAPMSSAAPATTQGISRSVTNQPASNVIEAGWTESEPSISPVIASTTFSQSTASQAVQPAQDFPVKGLAEARQNIAMTNSVSAVIPEASICQRVVDQSSVAPTQMAVAVSTATQNASTATANQPAQTLTAATSSETETIVAETSAVPTDAHQVSISQPVVDQSSGAIAQMPVVVPPTVQDTLTGIANDSTQAVSTKGTETLSNSTQPSVVPKTIAGPVSVQSNLTPLRNHESQSSSKLPAAPIQEMAPTIASSKSVNNDPGPVATVYPNSPVVTDHSGAQDSLAGVTLNAIPNAIENAVASDSIETTPVAASVPVSSSTRLASAKDAVAPALQTDANGQTRPQPVAEGTNSSANAIGVLSGVADQPMPLPPFDESLGTIQAIASSLKRVSTAKPQGSAVAGNKNSSAVQTEPKKTNEPASETASKASSQDAPSSGNQSQGGNASQAQNVAPIPVNIAGHSATAAAPTQSAATVSPVRASSTPSATGEAAAKTADNSAVQASTVSSQSQPVINTARLIQSMGQSEMHVGMRSIEFGNISINTSSSRDVISAQISVEHGELAKTLVTHLPEMQARLGGNQPADVRIDMNGAATGQGTGNFGGTSNDSSSQSRSGRPPAGNMVAGQSGSNAAEQQFTPVAAALPSGYARLDIRV